MFERYYNDKGGLIENMNKDRKERYNSSENNITLENVLNDIDMMKLERIMKAYNMIVKDDNLKYTDISDLVRDLLKGAIHREAVVLHLNTLLSDYGWNMAKEREHLSILLEKIETGEINISHLPCSIEDTLRSIRLEKYVLKDYYIPPEVSV